MEQVYDSEESSSGCESGWTLYLDIPHDEYLSSKKDTSPHEHDQEYDDGDEDDNMSMVSDASSGPPHFHEHQERDEDGDEYSNNNHEKSSIRVFCDPALALGSRKRRKVLNQTCFQDLPDFLDDTASSPLFGFSSNDLEMCNKDASMDDDDSFDYSQDDLKWSPSQGNSRSNEKDPSMQVEFRSYVRDM